MNDNSKKTSLQRKLGKETNMLFSGYHKTTLDINKYPLFNSIAIYCNVEKVAEIFCETKDIDRKILLSHLWTVCFH